MEHEQQALLIAAENERITVQHANEIAVERARVAELAAENDRMARQQEIRESGQTDAETDVGGLHIEHDEFEVVGIYMPGPFLQYTGTFSRNAKQIYEMHIFILLRISTAKTEEESAASNAFPENSAAMVGVQSTSANPAAMVGVQATSANSNLRTREMSGFNSGITTVKIEESADSTAFAENSAAMVGVEPTSVNSAPVMDMESTLTNFKRNVSNCSSFSESTFAYSESSDAPAHSEDSLELKFEALDSD